LANLQLTQKKIKRVGEGPAKEQLVEQVKHAAMQSTTEVAIVQVELGDLHNKITMPAK